ncbi:hypothetical protein CCMSSC00406_0006033 [Pleurotus cornucopiae]|uniref:Uncharacterized protein n=1 Tax=Pleurotus cornucopiae TaxID=5321 RepID=A0ACB7IPM7_PLECO|nr:hypothetical protein CCMSSC00406_0006033 [Pleurotus cornucopiae]
MRLLAIVSTVLSIIASSDVLGATVEAATEHSAPLIQVMVVGGRSIMISTVPVSIARLAKFPATDARNGTSKQQKSLTKRAVGNGCEVGCGGNGFCSNDLSPSPDPPTLGDCQTLKAVLDELALSEVTNTYPCNFPNSPLCPNFVVHPGFERVYSAGTVLSSYKDCIMNKGFTGSICFSNSNNLGVRWGLEVRHV